MANGRSIRLRFQRQRRFRQEALQANSQSPGGPPNSPALASSKDSSQSPPPGRLFTLAELTRGSRDQIASRLESQARFARGRAQAIGSRGRKGDTFQKIADRSSAAAKIIRENRGALSNLERETAGLARFPDKRRTEIRTKVLPQGDPQRERAEEGLRERSAAQAAAQEGTRFQSLSKPVRQQLLAQQSGGGTRAAQEATMQLSTEAFIRRREAPTGIQRGSLTGAQVVVQRGSPARTAGELVSRLQTADRLDPVRSAPPGSRVESQRAALAAEARRQAQPRVVPRGLPESSVQLNSPELIGPTSLGLATITRRQDVRNTNRRRISGIRDGSDVVRLFPLQAEERQALLSRSTLRTASIPSEEEFARQTESIQSQKESFFGGEGFQRIRDFSEAFASSLEPRRGLSAGVGVGSLLDSSGLRTAGGRGDKFTQPRSFGGRTAAFTTEFFLSAGVDTPSRAFFGARSLGATIPQLGRSGVTGAIAAESGSALSTLEKGSFSFLPGGTPINPEGAATLITAGVGAAIGGAGAGTTAPLRLATRLDPRFVSSQSGRFTVPTSQGPTQIRLGGSVAAISEPLSTQARLAGQRVDAVSGARGLFRRSSDTITVDKPLPTPDSPPLERSFFADPRGRLRPSRLGIQEEARLSDVISGEFTTLPNRPQAVLFPRTQVQRFPKELADIEAALKAGRPLTKSQEQRLLQFQLSPSGEFKPVGFLSREPEVTLAPGEVIVGEGTRGVTLIEGQRVPIIEASVRQASTLERNARVLGGDLRAARKAGLDTRLAESRPASSRPLLRTSRLTPPPSSPPRTSPSPNRSTSSPSQTTSAFSPSGASTSIAPSSPVSNISPSSGTSSPASAPSSSPSSPTSAPSSISSPSSPSRSPSPTSRFVPIRRTPPTRRPFIPRLERRGKDFVDSFRAFAKIQGVFRPVSGEVTREAALFRGASFVEGGAAASFQIRPTGRRIRAPDEPFTEDLDRLLSRFRSPLRRQTNESRKKRRGPDFRAGSPERGRQTFIERTKFRINTPGELKEITRKGLLSLRRAADRLEDNSRRRKRRRRR